MKFTKDDCKRSARFVGAAIATPAEPAGKQTKTRLVFTAAVVRCGRVNRFVYLGYYRL